MCVCIAHRREAPLMRYRFPNVGADLRKLYHQPGIQPTLRDHGYGLGYHAMCLFTPQLLPGTHSSLTTEHGLGALNHMFGDPKQICAVPIPPYFLLQPLHITLGN